MTQVQQKGQAGFTLVELAIVMIIVGLLIGGILKGQELIQNARVAATVSQVKAIDSGINTFYEAYKALPGDMQVQGANTPSSVIPNCINVCDQDGNGDGRITGVPGVAWATLAVGTAEGGTAFAELNAANILGGINLSAATTDAPMPGVSIPEAALPGSSIRVGYSTGTLTSGTIAAVRAGHYVLIDNSRAAAAAVGTASMIPGVAFRLDSKFDDGMPNTGSVIGMGANGGTGAGNCASANTAAAVYNQALTTTECGVYVRVGS